MSKFAKLLFVLFLLMGCTKPVDPDPDPDLKPKPKEEELFKSPQGNNVISPVSIPFVYGNPIEIIEEYKVRINTFSISGLKNIVNENKINAAISEKIEHLISYINSEKLPPYRGIYAKIPKETVATEYYIGTYPTYNFNNVLSIAFYGWYSFDINGNSEYVSLSDALNFDLTTGNLLTVSDLLTNDSNTQKQLSDQIALVIAKSLDSDDYFWDRPSITLAAPFKGIKGNQKFYISNSGFHFIFDYSNPEFDNGFMSVTLHVPYSKVMPYVAITQRFTTTGSIYEAPIRQAEFLYLNEAAVREETKTVIYRGVNVYSYRFLSTDVPQSYIDNLPDPVQLTYQMIDEVIDKYPIQSAYANVYASMVGEYVGLSTYNSVYSEDNYYKQWSITYNGKGEVVKLSDLFVNGYFYRNILRDEIKKNSGQSGIDDMEALLDSLQFTLDTAGISFNGFLPATETRGPYNIGFYVPYSTFGMENLTLFNHE